MGIPCDIVKDLLPSYIDGLVSETAKKEIEAHTESCGSCREALESMRGGQSEEKEEAGKEIDYLKKNRKRNKRIVLISVLAACLAVLAFLFVRLFVIGDYARPEAINCRVEVEGRRVTVEASTEDGMRTIGNIGFIEENGVVSIYTRTVLTGLFGKKEAHAEYTAGEEIKKVVFNNGVLWKELPANGGFSEAMLRDIRLSWEHYNSLSETERMLLSTSPGYISKYFTDWDSAKEYLGMEIFDPLESSKLVFMPKNFGGTDVREPVSGQLSHASVDASGTEDGTVLYVSLTAGYAVDPSRTEGYGGSVAIDPAAPHETSAPESEPIRVTWTAEPIVRLRYDYTEGSERRELANGTAIFCRRTDSGYRKGAASNQWFASEVFFDLDGVHYSVRILSRNGGKALDGVTDTVITLIEDGIRNR